MKLNELIKHLKNFEEKGYEDYEVSVKNSAGQCVLCTLFTIDTENEKIRLL